MESKLDALEEEVSILKGEIKAILQEVRTAVLDVENPFSRASFFAPPTVTATFDSPTPGVIPSPGPDAMQPQTSPASTEPEQAETAPDAVAEKPMLSAARPTPLLPFPTLPDRDAPLQAAVDPVIDVMSLAALMVWVEETRHLMDDNHLRMVLGLSRYGGLIDVELEKVLLEISAQIEYGRQPQHVSVNDCLVAIRQLDALMAGGRLDELSLARRARRPVRRPKEPTEVQASRRQ